MYGIAITFYLLICLAMVISILLQSAKGEGLAGAFGGSSLTGTVFGGRGAATFLSRATTYLGAAFMLMAIMLSFMRPATGQQPGLPGTSAVEEAARQNPLPATSPVTQDVTPAPGQPATGQQGQQATPVEDLFQDPGGTEGTDAEQPGDSI